MGEGVFAVAVREEMAETDRADYAKGLALELLWKSRSGGARYFLTARHWYVRFPEDGDTAAGLLQKAAELFYRPSK